MCVHVRVITSGVTHSLPNAALIRYVGQVRLTGLWRERLPLLIAFRVALGVYAARFWRFIFFRRRRRSDLLNESQSISSGSM